MDKGFIMCGDKYVATFEGRTVIPLLEPLVPLCFRKGGDLEWWLSSRAIDRHRTNSRILKRLLRISDTSDLNTVMRVHGACITDNYWVKLDHEVELTWEDVRFSSDYFSAVALHGDINSFAKEYTEKQLTAPTPELTNVGSFEKCWYLENGCWVLHKTGTAEALFSEVFTYELGRELGFSMAKYFYRDGVVVSPDFTAGRLNLEPMANLVYDDEDYSRSYDTLRALKPGLEREYLDILFMDALVFNVDRHTNNYGVLRARETGEVLCMAPNYDNNLALISRGYLPNPESAANMFVDLLSDLLHEKCIKYDVPVLAEEKLQVIADMCIPAAAVNRPYVQKFVWSNYQKLCKALL